MTTNQVAYAKVREEQRHNREMEQLQSAQTNEQARHNLATEYETNRYNVENLSEVKRSNLVNEGIMQFNANTNAKNAQTNEFNAQVNAWNAATNERNAATNERNADINAFNAQVNAYNAESNRMQAQAAMQNANTNAWSAAQQAGIGWSNVAVAERQADIAQQNADTASRNADTAWFNAQTTYSDFVSQSLLRESQIDVNTENARRTEELLPYEKWNYATGSAENITDSIQHLTQSWSNLGKSGDLNHSISNLATNIGLLAIKLIGG